jgi:phosphoserine aminotransferase
VKVQSELLDFNGTGMSLMEMSHRSAAFTKVIKEAEADLCELLNVPATHQGVLF